MARIRTIKPDFFLHDGLAELPALDRLLFIGLWTQADREGRLEDRIKRIKVAILPYDDHDIDSALNRLQEKKFITRYSVNGDNYLQINNFLKHQYPNVKEGASTIPAPCKHDTSIPHSGKEGKGTIKGKERKGKVQERETKCVSNLSTTALNDSNREGFSSRAFNMPTEKTIDHNKRKAELQKQIDTVKKQEEESDPF